METPEHRRSATRHHLLRGNIKLLLNADPKSPNPDLRNITNQRVQSLHSSCASRSVSATSSVEYSHQEPVKRTAEANHLADSIREHSDRNSTHSPKTNRRNDQSPENPKNSKVTPSTHLHLKFAETTPKRGAGRQRNGAPKVTTNRPVLPPVRREQPLLRGTEDHQTRTSNANYRRNGRRHSLLTLDDRWYRPTLRNDPRLNLHQKTTEADSLRRHHPRKTELCGRPAVSQIGVQLNNAETS